MKGVVQKCLHYSRVTRLGSLLSGMEQNPQCIAMHINQFHVVHKVPSRYIKISDIQYITV